MSYLPSQGGHSTFAPIKIRASAPVPVYGAYTPGNVNFFPIEQGTKYINVILTITGATGPETYYVRMAHSLDIEPNVPGSFDLIRSDIFVPATSHYEQTVIEKRYTNFPSPGGTVISTFPITNFSSKWGRVDLSCSNVSSTPSISIYIVQGR